MIMIIIMIDMIRGLIMIMITKENIMVMKMIIKNRIKKGKKGKRRKQ